MAPEVMSLAMRDFILAFSVFGTFATAKALHERGQRLRAEGLLFAFENKVFELTPENCLCESAEWACEAIAYCRDLINCHEFKEAITYMESCLCDLDKFHSL